MKTKQPRHTIHIDKDCHISLKTKDDILMFHEGYKKRIGTIGVDVEIIDLRGDPVQQERARIIEEVKKLDECFSEYDNEDEEPALNKADIIKIIKGK